MVPVTEREVVPTVVPKPNGDSVTEEEQSFQLFHPQLNRSQATPGPTVSITDAAASSQLSTEYLAPLAWADRSRARIVAGTRFVELHFLQQSSIPALNN